MPRDRRRAMIALAVGVLLLITAAVGFSVLTAKRSGVVTMPAVLPY